jgi:hypothetical protein
LTAQMAFYTPEIIPSEPNFFRRSPGDRQPRSRAIRPRSSFSGDAGAE